MSIATNATILRFQDGSSDKVWVMCHDAAPTTGDHLVFWGATRWRGHATGVLQSKAVSGSADSRIAKKLKEGYQVWSGVVFDKDEGRVFHQDAKPMPEDTKPLVTPNFWYRIDPAVSTADISSFLDELCQGLADYETESNTSVLVDQFNALSLTAALRAGEHSGTSEYSESPMAALLLHSIRRAWKSFVLVSDDNNEMMPDRLDDLYEILCNEHLFGQMPDLWMPPAFNEIAIALRCIDRPVNLANLTTEKPAAFF